MPVYFARSYASANQTINGWTTATFGTKDDDPSGIFDGPTNFNQITLPEDSMIINLSSARISGSGEGNENSLARVIHSGVNGIPRGSGASNDGYSGGIVKWLDTYLMTNMVWGWGETGDNAYLQFYRTSGGHTVIPDTDKTQCKWLLIPDGSGPTGIQAFGHNSNLALVNAKQALTGPMTWDRDAIHNATGANWLGADDQTFTIPHDGICWWSHTYLDHTNITQQRCAMNVMAKVNDTEDTAYRGGCKMQRTGWRSQCQNIMRVSAGDELTFYWQWQSFSSGDTYEPRGYSTDSFDYGQLVIRMYQES